jgi:hypothetical protein
MFMSTNRSHLTPLVVGLLLIGVGFLALLGQIFTHFDFWHYFWPFFVIGSGGLFFVAMLIGGRSLAALAIPGSIITVTGLMLMVQNAFGYWETWSYSWTVTIISVGLGIYIMGAYQDDEHRRQAGLSVMKVGAWLFIIFGAFFELVLMPSRFPGAQYAFPILLILFGVILLVARSGLFGGRKTESETHQNPSA